MKSDDRQTLIQLRLNQANETLEESQVLLDHAHSPRGVINRAYYAMFYAIQALALYKQHPVSKHSGNIAFFDKEFVKTGIFDKSFSHNLHNVFEQRQRVDYRETTQPSIESAREILKDAGTFVRGISDFLTTTGQE